MSCFNRLITLISFLFVLGVLVFIHEFGHFIAAKRAGVYVETFSIGMGPKLLKKTYGDTEYCLSAIPLGGYVKMKGENPDEDVTGAPDELNSKSIPARFSIFVAGPGMNLLFAVFLVSLVFYIGKPMPKYWDEVPLVGWIEEDSPAQQVGLQPGDIILEVDGEPVNTWEQAVLFIASTGDNALNLKIERDGVVQQITVTPEIIEGFGAGDIGIRPALKPIVGGLHPPGFPAEEAGLQVGDEILSINGQKIIHWDQMADIINAHPGEELELVVRRGDDTFETRLTPKDGGDGRYYLGIRSQQQVVLKKFGPLESISRGIERCWELTTMTFDMLRRLVTYKASPKTLGGPIMIAQMSGEVARRSLSEFLDFMGLVSLSLAIFNLLPIPVLDGGHIFLLLIEFLHRKPLSMEKRELAQKIGLLILIPLFLFVFYNDIARVLGW